jgi:hypothetical protein
MVGAAVAAYELGTLERVKIGKPRGRHKERRPLLRDQRTSCANINITSG